MPGRPANGRGRTCELHRKGGFCEALDTPQAMPNRGSRRPVKLVQGQIETRSQRAYAMGIEGECAPKRGFRGGHEGLHRLSA